MARQIYKVISEFVNESLKDIFNDKLMSRRKWMWSLDDHNRIWMLYKSCSMFLVPERLNLFHPDYLRNKVPTAYNIQKLTVLPPNAEEVYKECQLTDRNGTELIRWQTKLGAKCYMELSLFKMLQKYSDYDEGAQIFYEGYRFFLVEDGQVTAVILGVRTHDD